MNWKEVRSTLTLVSETWVPEPWRILEGTPMIERVRSASRTDARETPSSRARSRSGGSWAPGP